MNSSTWRNLSTRNITDCSARRLIYWKNSLNIVRLRPHGQAIFYRGGFSSRRIHTRKTGNEMALLCVAEDFAGATSALNGLRLYILLSAWPEM